MSTAAITIYDAKTNLSKLIKRAAAGETIYVGSFGKAEAVIAPLPVITKKKIQLGAFKGRKNTWYDDELFNSADEDIKKMFGPDYGFDS
jgi:antitoxin (DNA-binding transcriptional repressor) of toxin-antitoxin stability system